MSSAISVVGFGAVGRVLCSQAVRKGIPVLAVADSTCAVIGTAGGFNPEEMAGLSKFKADGGRLNEYPCSNGQAVVQLTELTSHLPQGSVLADCSATDATTPLLLAAQAKGVALALANKKPLTGPLSEFATLTANRSLIRFESTVGAGLPINSSLRRVTDSGDKVEVVQGQFSGTLGYVLSELQLKKPFSEIVRNAKAQGFTEPDPRDDLSGVDVARKALILSRCMGGKFEISDITIEALFPDSMADLSLEEFMEALPSLDEGMAARVSSAAEKGNKLRYAAEVTATSINVGLVECGPENALAALTGTDNLVSITSEWYQSPLVISGPGAGLEVTAAGVLSDAIELGAGKLMSSKWGL